MSIEISIISLKNKMVAQTHKSRVIANNLANINTTGFKKDEMFFNVLEQTTQMKVETDFSQGALIETSNPLDFALSGRGFFVIETDEGEAYTRNGHFMSGSDGILRTSDGKPVLGNRGLIDISLDGEQTGKFTVSAKGEIFIDDEFIDTLKIMDFDNLSGLKKSGKDLLVEDGNALGGVADNPTIFQGKLEESNVNPANEMINLIELHRQYESSQKSLKAIDDALKKAATQVSQYR